MAYKNLVNIACASKIEYFCRLRDFLCSRNGTYDYSTTGIGWTLHDSSYVVDEDNPQDNDWYVLYSAGENGLEDMYIKIVWGTNSFDMYGYLYWNATTHAGIQPYGTLNAFNIDETGTYRLYVYGDLDFFNFWETDNEVTYDNIGMYGKLDDLPNDPTIVTSTGALSAGTDVTINCSSVPAAWTVGLKIYIRDNANIKIITIKTIVGSAITADLTTSFASGCKLSGDIGYACKNSATAFYLATMCNRTTGAADTSLREFHAAGTMTTYDDLNQVRIAFKLHQGTTSTYYGSVPNMLFVTYGGLAIGDVLVDRSGVSWRFLKYYSTYYLIVKEV